MSAARSPDILTLPCLSHDHMQFWNRIHAHRAGLTISHGTLRFGSAGHPTDPKQINVHLPQGNFSVFCPGILLDKILGALQPGLRISDVAADLLGMLVEFAFEPDLLSATAASPATIEMADGIQADDQDGFDVSLIFDAFGSSWPILVHGDMATLDHVFRLWPAVPNQLAGLTLPSAVRLGSTRLTATMIESLRSGDVVLFERTHAALPRGLVVAAGHWAAPLTFGTDGWRMDSPFAPLPVEEKTWMTPEKKSLSAANVKDPGDIPVTLGFDLGEIEIPINDLRQLAAGSVLQMPRPGEAPVRVTANGRTVGSGELVRVEGRIGVKLLRIFEHE